MDFELPLEHQIAYESAFAFARDEIKPHNDEIERTDDFPPWIWKRLAEQGYTGIAIPEEYGGSGRDFLIAALLARPLRPTTGGISPAFCAHPHPLPPQIHPKRTQAQEQTY